MVTRPGLTMVVLLVLTLLIPQGGCTAIGTAGALTGSDTVVPSYVGLKGQSIGVMAWADESVRFEYNMLLLDVTRGVNKKLQGSQANGATELKGTTFPRDKGPDALFAYQSNHPEMAVDPIAEVAPKLGVQRLIYIELDGMDLHSGAVVDLYRGTLSGKVQVVEVANGRGKVVFNAVVSASYPDKSPEEGMPNLTDQQTYIGTLDVFCTAVVQKFVSYASEK